MKLVIVGGVAGGASAAARARRLSEDAQIVLIERGPDVSFANCGLPYHIGGEIAQRDGLGREEQQGLDLALEVGHDAPPPPTAAPAAGDAAGGMRARPAARTGIRSRARR